MFPITESARARRINPTARLVNRARVRSLSRRETLEEANSGPVVVGPVMKRPVLRFGAVRGSRVDQRGSMVLGISIRGSRSLMKRIEERRDNGDGHATRDVQRSWVYSDPGRQKYDNTV